MELKPHFDILIPGNYFCDIIFTELPRFPSLGTEIYCGGLKVVPGGVLNTVIALQRLGVKIGWIGALGNDFFSQLIVHQTQTEGIDTALIRRLDQPMQRVTVSLSYPADRAFVSYVDASPNYVDLAYEGLERATISHLHFTGLVVDERMPALIDTCHSRGIVVSMDCQHREQTLELDVVYQIIRRLDIFMPNMTEAARLTGLSEREAIIGRLRSLVPLLVIKAGAEGAFAWQGDAQHYVPALHFDQVVDTTGAGDVFNAGFLAAYRQHKDIPTCLAWGNFCGGMSTQGIGGLSAAPTYAQLAAWLAGAK